MEYTYSFTAEIKAYDFNRYIYSAVYLPSKLCKQLDLKSNPRLRVRGVIADCPFDGACQPAGDETWYLMLSKKFLKQNKLEMGDRVTVSFDVADQDAVEVPKELQHALNANTRAGTIWAALTPGKQRGFAYRVSSAKREATRAKRVEEVIEGLLEL